MRLPLTIRFAAVLLLALLVPQAALHGPDQPQTPGRRSAP